MQELVIKKDGRQTTTSKIVADVFGKTHRDVLRIIDGMHCSEEFRSGNFSASSYTSPQNKVMPCIEMTRDGFCFLAMGFNGAAAGKWKESFLKAFNELESAANAKGVMQSLNEAIARMEADKSQASLAGSVLAAWKMVRAEHIAAVTSAHARAQLVLNFSG